MMNYYTKEIMAKLKCDAEYALKVQDLMGEFLDFSECSNRQFNKAIKDAVLILKERTV